MDPAAICARSTLESLSASERVGQLLMVGLDTNAAATSLDDEFAAAHVGGAILLGGWEGRSKVVAATRHLAGQRTQGVGVLVAADERLAEPAVRHRLRLPGLPPLLALGPALAVLAPLAWLWQASRMPGEYSVMDMGYADYGGGPTAAGSGHDSSGDAHGSMDHGETEGVTSVADHRVEALEEGRSRLTLSVDMRGLLIPVIALFYKDLTNRYMTLEAEGMKRAAESAET